MRTQLFAAGLLAATSLVVTSAPAHADAQPQIIGGHPAPNTSWMASLQWEAPKWGVNQFNHTCGGSLVFRGWVVTNAHCVTDMPDDQKPDQRAETLARYAMTAGGADIPAADKKFRVRVGSKDRTSGGQLANVVAIYVHPGWAWGEKPGEVDDIAMLKLDHDLDAQPITLADGAVQPGTTVTQYGWGIDQPSSTGTIPRQLQQITTTALNPDACAPQEPTISAKEICLANPHNTDGMCFGDSGGPAVEVVDGVPELVGGASRNQYFYCGLSPAIYTSTPEFRSFVYDTARGVPAPSVQLGGRVDGAPAR